MSGNKLPTNGITGANPYPSAGWTSVQNSDMDDESINIPLPFTVYMFGTGYNSVYFGSNTYLTFGGGSSEYSNLSATNPALSKIHFGASDNSSQRIAYYTTDKYVRIRYEGSSSTEGTAGSPTIVVEFTIFNPMYIQGGNTIIEMLVGNHDITDGQAMIANASGSISVAYTLTPSTSYVFEGDSTGNNFQVLSSHYVDNVEY